MKTLLQRTLLSALLVSANAVHAYSTNNGVIYDSAGKAVQLRGVNWFGFETGNYVAHGLWTRNWKDMINQMKTVGFNAVRIPICPGTLKGATANSIDYAQNPDLVGKNSLQILDMVLAEFNRQGMYILLDHHRPDCNGGITELWYTGSYSEQTWIDDLVFMANRYKTLPYMLGIDLKNEPHGMATWGMSNPATDWNTAAEKAGTAILSAAPNLLIFVEGIESSTICSGSINHWWGGNLEPLNCTPLSIPANRLVLSPHVYGPDVYNQPYFNDATFPNNMPAIWTAHFGQFRNAGYTIAIGETGGKYGHGGSAKDKVFQDSLVDYLINKDITNLFYWSWNPNSGDTGGILQDDWRSVWQDKLDLLNTLWNKGVPTAPACSDTKDNDADGKIDYPADPGCSSASDLDETDTPPPPAAACSDKIDNDSDGLIDYPNDPGCSSATDTDESNPPPVLAACADKLDNDNDGLVDYPNDPGCSSSSDTDEYNAPPAPVKTSLPATVSLTSDWGAGYCADVKVTNSSGASVEWTTAFKVPGTINNFWSALYTKSGDDVTASGLEWNKVLAANASTTFGFCATRPVVAPKNACEDSKDNDGDGKIDYPNDPGCSALTDNDETDPSAGSITATLTQTTDWGSGYCANVDVKNSGTTAVQWQISLPIQGTIYNLWNAVYTQTGNTLTAKGVSWNQQVAAGGTVQFGFCANR